MCRFKSGVPKWAFRVLVCVNVNSLCPLEAGGAEQSSKWQTERQQAVGCWLLALWQWKSGKWKRQRQKQSVETVGSQQKTANRQTTDKCTLLPNEASQKHGPRHNVCPCFCAEKCIHAALRRPSHTARKWGQYWMISS